MQDVTLLRMDGPRCSKSLCYRILLPLFSVSPLICCEILMAKRCAAAAAWGMEDGGVSCGSVCLMDSDGKPEHVLFLAAMVGH